MPQLFVPTNSVSANSVSANSVSIPSGSTRSGSTRSGSTRSVRVSTPITDQNAAILDRLKSGQLLTLDPGCQGGLIILKSFYADFAGAGAAIGGAFDLACTAVYVVGSVQLQPAPREQREEALNTRIACAEMLAEIASIPVPLRRSYRIVEQLSQWLSREVAATIPAELIAKMVGVLPISVELAQQSRQELADDTPTLLSERPAHKVPM